MGIACPVMGGQRAAREARSIGRNETTPGKSRFEAFEAGESKGGNVE